MNVQTVLMTVMWTLNVSTLLEALRVTVQLVLKLMKATVKVRPSMLCWQWNSRRQQLLLQWFLLTRADIDECTNGPNDCDVNFECVNTLGSFTCECPTGFEINEGNCEGETLYVC
jgi:hypothetical protein